MSLTTPAKDYPSGLEVHLSPSFDKELRKLICERTGIVTQDHQQENLNKVVATAMQRFGYEHCESYLEFLRSAEKDSPELEFLVSGITVGESYFFRDTGQIDFLRQQYLPALIAKRAQTSKHLRIWSAGSSDGQELYTLAFLLRGFDP